MPPAPVNAYLVCGGLYHDMDYARLERKDDTLHFLEGAFQERNPEMVFLQKKPDFVFLYSDPRFQALVKKVGLPPVP